MHITSTPPRKLQQFTALLVLIPSIAVTVLLVLLIRSVPSDQSGLWAIYSVYLAGYAVVIFQLRTIWRALVAGVMYKSREAYMKAAIRCAIVTLIFMLFGMMHNYLAGDAQGHGLFSGPNLPTILRTSTAIYMAMIGLGVFLEAGRCAEDS
ncbi:hypothetical protein TUM12370_19050 [Salmonella enterica subsp. enterica serovar Choleraesuis]|nr:hypothetical protein TUM12370_19050 [Salmonella enterica subsp. enterica serovar Choleraesuis]